MTILQDLSQDQMLAMIAKLQADNAALKAKANGGNGFKVTDKGGVSVYGLGRFPVTLYRSQWEALFGKVEALKAFIEANADKLAVRE
jgi:hypothetical protein